MSAPTSLVMCMYGAWTSLCAAPGRKASVQEVGLDWQLVQELQPKKGGMAKQCPQSPWRPWGESQQSLAKLFGKWHGRRATDTSRKLHQARVTAD